MHVMPAQSGRVARDGSLSKEERLVRRFFDKGHPDHLSSLGLATKDAQGRSAAWVAGARPFPRAWGVRGSSPSPGKCRPAGRTSERDSFSKVTRTSDCRSHGLQPRLGKRGDAVALNEGSARPLHCRLAQADGADEHCTIAKPLQL